LTTTGTSGAATLSSNTLNIPQYQAVLTNPVTGTGTSGYHAKWTSSSAIGNGLIYDTGANIGINTTSPSVNANQTSLTINGTNVSRLDMQVSGTRNAGFVVASDAAYLETTAAIPLVFYTNSTEKMRITSDGKVGINTTTPGAKLEVKGNSTDGWIKLSTTSGNPYISSTNEIGFYTSNTVTSLYLFGSGNVGINNTTDNGYKLYVAGTIYATGNITANSDLTLKKNLELITNPTDKLMQLNGYSYQWKEDDSHQYGVIAQEVEKILPYAVSTGNDGIKGVSYNQIIPVLIEAVKEQKAKIENLEILLASK